MTSAQVHLVPIDSIWVNREKRQRRELKDLEPLAASIASIGLINFPVVTREHELIAGERRLEAMRLLSWLEVPVHYTDELEPDRLHIIELEENVKRSDLSWAEINQAVVSYHMAQRKTDPEWTQEMTAKALNMSKADVSRHLIIETAAKAAPELKIREAENFSTANGLAQRALERRSSSNLEALTGPSPEPVDLNGTPLPPKKGEILTQDFLKWKTKERFNFLHCDFPYGVKTGSKTTGQSATKRLGHYDDGEDVYWTLLEYLCAQTPKLCEPQAHLMFWFSMRFYEPTKKRLEDAGWRVDPFPLIWMKSDNSGIIPDSNRGPRRGYETCLFASLGDRKIVSPVSNIIACANPRENHAHEKPQEALRHFMRMIVDSSTRMLDPTCGSGSAVRAAEALGASLALGLEKDPEFAERARKFVAA